MIAVCITGMHESGASMVAQILHECGMDLGPSNQREIATDSGLSGSWTHVEFVNINHEILTRFDGGWDNPPSFPPDWPRSSKLEDMRDRAETLIAGFSEKPVWGWADPCNALTLPFWKDMIPGLKVIHCVRSPVEVCRTLKKRSEKPEEFYLSLWDHYINSILASTRDGPYLATSYHNYLLRPVDEISRVAGFTGLKLSPGEISKIAGLFSQSSYFSQTSTLDELLSMPDRTKNLYIQVVGDANESFINMTKKLDTNGSSFHITALHAYEMEQLAQILSTQIAGQEQQRNVLLAQLEFKEQQTQNLIPQAKELAEIKGSRAWKLIQTLWKTKVRFNRFKG